jgi:hypothetical protein
LFQVLIGVMTSARAAVEMFGRRHPLSAAFAPVATSGMPVSSIAIW